MPITLSLGKCLKLDQNKRFLNKNKIENKVLSMNNYNFFSNTVINLFYFFISSYFFYSTPILAA